MRAQVAGTIPVTVAPTPEFNELFQIPIASMPAPSEDDDMLFTVSGFLALVPRQRQPDPAHGHPSTAPTPTPSLLGVTPTAYPGRSSSATSRPSPPPPWPWPPSSPSTPRPSKAETFTPVCESYFDDDREVRFTVPYEAAGPLRQSTSPGSRAAWRRLAASDNVPSVNFPRSGTVGFLPAKLKTLPNA